MASNNSGGPWGGNGNRGGSDNDNRGGGGQRPGGGGNQPPQMPEIDEIVRKGQEQLRVLMGGRGGGTGRGSDGGGLPGGGINRTTVGIGILALVALWLFASLYRVDTSEQSVELLFGDYIQTGEEGLNFAPWPVVTKEIRAVTRENTEDIGVGRGSRSDSGLMLTGDENIVDIDFQVVWNINDLQKFLFNLAQPEDTIRAVSEGTITLTATGTHEPTGDVVTVDIETSPLPEVGKCIAKATKGWTFPKPGDGGEVQVRFPFEVKG